MRTLKAAPKDDVTVLLLCCLLTVLFDMTVAVTLGIGLAAMSFVRRSITLTSAVKVENLHVSYGELPNKIAIYNINGPLFFGSAQKALQALSTVTPNLRVVILDMTEINNST